MYERKCEVSCHTHRAIQKIILIFYRHQKGKYANLYNLCYLSYANQDQCLILKMAYTCMHMYIYMHLHTYIYVWKCIYTHTDIIPFNYPARKNLFRS